MLVMIALPVLAVTTADVVMHTQDVRGAESLDRRLGSATASVTAEAGSGKYLQAPDPETNAFSEGGDGTTPMLTADQVRAELGGARLVERRSGDLRVVSEKGVATAEATEIDLHDPVVAGLFRLERGRLPKAPDEVVINGALMKKGYALGDRLKLPGDTGSTTGSTPTVVGVVESTTVRDYPLAAGPLGSLGLKPEGSTTWLVDGADVTWKQVRSLNEGGATVLSRSVVLHPPPSSEIPEEVRGSGGTDSVTVSIAILVVVMTLIEVVLLAGPAFAVGARRQSRSLALLAATGGTPKQARRVVLANAVVLGLTAALLGALLGIGLAFAVIPVLQSFSGTWFGPFEVPWLQLVGIAAFGLVSALLAAVVPAHIASRQDVVAVLAGRRGDQPPSLRSPLIGLVLLGIGIAGAAVGATRAGGETLIAFSAIFSVLGMILLVPVVLGALSRLSRHLPLTLRYAVRDAARHRTRTVPAVAAVAATVAGVVALSIANASDAAENEATYTPSTSAGVGVLASYAAKTDWAAYRSVVERQVPGADVSEVRGIPPQTEDGSSTTVTISLRGQEEPLLDRYGSALGSDLVVSDSALPPGMIGISPAEASRASQALSAGGAVVFTPRRAPAGTTPVHAAVSSYSGVGDGSESKDTAHDFDATLIQVAASEGPQAVVSSKVARTLGVPVSQVALVLTGVAVTKDQEAAVTEGAAAISDETSFGVERGFQADDATRIVQLILAGLGALLMLGGTLTATFLALSDARPDLATLSAIGASPRTRRRVAAAYALVVGVVGASLGALVGFIPGIAVSYPLTRIDGVVSYGSGYVSGNGGSGPFLDVPWLLVIGLVVLLPLVTAAIVGLTARSRLPLVARLD